MQLVAEKPATDTIRAKFNYIVDTGVPPVDGRVKSGAGTPAAGNDMETGQFGMGIVGSAGGSAGSKPARPQDAG